jgi:long-chain fatty acid transport protein
MRLPVRLMVLLTGLPSCCLLGLGIRIADQDPVATARGNAFAATADNPSAIYYNPAGITQLEGNNASLSGYGITLKSTYDSPATTRDVSTDSEFQLVPHFYYTCSSSGLPLSFGVGMYAPYGLGLEWPDDTGFRTLAKEGRIIYLTFNPVVAWRILPTLSAGAGLTVNYAQTTLKRGIVVPGDEFKFKGDDTDVGYNVGLLWQPHPQHSFGANYRNATTLDFDGNSHTRLIVPFSFEGSQSASARFHFPQNVVVGWSFRPTTNWNFEVNVDWTDWDSLDTVTLKQGTGDVTLPFNWRSSFFYEFGATRHFEHQLSISAGYIYSENTVPDSSFNPIVPDSDRHIFSVGIGQKYNQLRWDAAYQLAYGPARTVSNSPPSPIGESADGRYEFISHAFSLSVGYTF